MIERPLQRVLSVAEADELIGAKVKDLEPNVREEGLYRDADTGEPMLVYGPWPGDRESLARYRWALLNAPASPNGVLRSAGVRNEAGSFGYAPRNVVLRRESCRVAGMAERAPEAHAIIASEATRFHNWLKDIVPEVVKAGWETDVDDDWRLTEESYWTSGVVNITSVLPYHRDRNNFPVWSVMPVVRRGVKGGYLHMPEYDAVLACRDGWVVAFPGEAIVHGVTPMKAQVKGAYRISSVYYCLKGMRNCAEDALEQGEARLRRTERESRMGVPEENTLEAVSKRVTGRATGGTGMAKPRKTGP